MQSRLLDPHLHSRSAVPRWIYFAPFPMGMIAASGSAVLRRFRMGFSVPEPYKGLLYFVTS